MMRIMRRNELQSTEVSCQKGYYTIGSWADHRYHENYAVETSVHEPGEDEPHEGFTTEELLNHQKRSDTNSLFAEAC